MFVYEPNSSSLELKIILIFVFVTSINQRVSMVLCVLNERFARHLLNYIFRIIRAAVSSYSVKICW